MFQGCSGLTSVTIPESVTSIGEGAFDGCTGLFTVTINSNAIASNSSNDVFGTQVKTYVFGNEVKSIGSIFARNNTNLRSVTIGPGVLSIGYNAFSTPTKVIWLTNTPPSGYNNASGKVNYVANDLYTSLSNKKVYPYLSSLFEVGGIKYVPVSPSERTCDIIDCNYDSSAEHVNIGKTVSYKGINMKVKEMNPYSCYDNTCIKDVQLVFEGNVGEYAFLGCSGIQNVTINTVGDIEQSAFASISGSFTATVNNTGYICASAFKGSIGLTSLEVGSNVTDLGSEAFSGCSGLTNATLQNNGKVNNNSFQGCSKLEVATLGNNITSIGEYAFDGCSSLPTINIPNSVTSIEAYAFQNCYQMASTKIGAGVESIGSYAFNGCSSLPTIRIPKSVNTIGDYTFKSCKALTEVIMEEKTSELTLGSNGNTPLFADCPLDTVYIGRNITYSTSSDKGYSPFYRNTSLRSIHVTDKETEISENEFYGCKNLKNVRLGDGITTIGDWAFSGCSSIDYFLFGKSTKEIGKETFSDCTAMTRLISRAANPPTCGDQALDDINKWNCTLEVPIGSLSAYQTSPQWKEFFFMNEVDGIEDVNVNGDDDAKHNGRKKVIYNLDGRRQPKMQKGLNIIKYADGSVKRIMGRK